MLASSQWCRFAAPARPFEGSLSQISTPMRLRPSSSPNHSHNASTATAAGERRGLCRCFWEPTIQLVERCQSDGCGCGPRDCAGALPNRWLISSAKGLVGPAGRDEAPAAGHFWPNVCCPLAIKKGRNGSWSCNNALVGFRRADWRCGRRCVRYARIAAISGLMPTMFMTRVRL
jgi:hypothetical protein